MLAFQQHDGPVTSLSFCTTAAKEATSTLLASGSTSGQVHLWDLQASLRPTRVGGGRARARLTPTRASQSGSLKHTIVGAHKDRVVSVAVRVRACT